MLEISKILGDPDRIGLELGFAWTVLLLLGIGIDMRTQFRRLLSMKFAPRVETAGRSY